MGFWKKFVSFLKANASKNTEVISKNFGAMAIMWCISGISILISFILTGKIDYVTPVTLGLGGTSQFLVVLLRSVFGKKKEEET